MQNGYGLRTYQLTLVDETYHFHDWKLSSHGESVALSKKFNPQFKGYPCATILKEDIILTVDKDEVSIAYVQLDGDKALVKVLYRCEPGIAEEGPIPMNVS